MNRYKIFFGIVFLFFIVGCNENKHFSKVNIFETSASGNKLTKLNEINPEENNIALEVKPDEKFQHIIGFGGAFTESSAYLLNKLSKENRENVLQAYFGNEGAQYSLTRTHINSCDFSVSNYSYAPVAGDTALKNFSIKEDADDIIPMIKDAMEISTEGFKVLASPWTAPPWMKDNNDWKGGKLLPEYYSTWALFFSKYITAYRNEGIDIWGVTVENEPLGNNNNWESMHFNPTEMIDFTNNYLGPKLEADGHSSLIFGYDQNRGEDLKEWADAMYKDSTTGKYFDGMAVHWYASTIDWMAESLEYTHKLAPEKPIIQSEACVDAEIPQWKDDAWYWKKEATDWGWDWAGPESRHLHPKYAPVYRYARDIIGCMNSWVSGWIDWNMVLDTHGGPNWAKNWCVAPVIVNPDSNQVYYTPIYYTLAHFSKYIRPNAVRIGFDLQDDDLMATAVKNTDNSIVVIVLNMTEEEKTITLSLGGKTTATQIKGQAIQTIVLFE